MKLTRLRLLGFKSFVEPTDFLIEPGLTGVVGPNGCGKSNLVEALRWVMGETSHKSLRAADMDDVIFAGTNTRPGRNNAEVAMHIDNSTRNAPAQFNDTESLDVSRRIERDQGSTYRINGREVRARDVQILFADASTGSRSPALVHQGRIGEIIQAKPEQRRRVLEEAAGISGLHARRHEAELRLRAAEQNLAAARRRHQPARARRWRRSRPRRVRRCATAISPARSAGRKPRCSTCAGSAASAELAEAEQAKNLAVRIVAERTGAQAEAATRQALAAAELPALREAEAAAAAGLHRLVVARETLEREEARARERMAELDRRLVQLGGDIERERQHVADAEAALDQARRRRGSRSSTTSTPTRRSAPAPRRAWPRPTRCCGTAEKTFGELTGTLADLTARRNALEQAARAHDDRLARLCNEIAAVEAELRLARGCQCRPSRPCGARTSPPRRRRRRDGGGSVVSCAPRPPIRPPARRSTSPAARSPKPSAARNASIPKPRRWRSSCTSTPRICGRR